MRTTIELPDELLMMAKRNASLHGISLRQFFIDAVQDRLASKRRKVRKAPPAIGDANASPLRTLTRDQIDEAMFA